MGPILGLPVGKFPERLSLFEQIIARPLRRPTEAAVLSYVRPSPRVLLIDPSDAGRAVLAERLRFQGFVVIECKDGAEGAIQALEEAPDAVIADLSMPSIS